MDDTFPWLILFITSITLALGVALLLRTRKSVRGQKMVAGTISRLDSSTPT
jgi:uncharacterized membrane-anchored protein YitT (DUF2179 family)